MKKITIIILSLFLAITLVGCDSSKNKTLRIGVTQIASSVNPFLYQTSADKDVMDLTFIRLFPFDRAGNILYGASENVGVKDDNGYSYYGIASLTETANDDGSYTYIIRVRDDVYCSNGDIVTAKDIVFDYYVLFDPNFYKVMYSSGTDQEKLNRFNATWEAQFQSLPLSGLSDYQTAIKKAYAQSDTAKKDAMLNAATIDGIDSWADTISLTMTRALSEEEKKLLNIYVAPESQFSDGTVYAFDLLSYGFVKGNLTGVLLQNNVIGVSSGAYLIVSISSTIKFRKNAAYFLGTPKIEYLEMTLLTGLIRDEDGYVKKGGDIYYQISDNKLDIGEVTVDSISKNEMIRYNSNSLVNGNILSLYELKNSLYPGMENSVKGLVYSTKRFDASVLSELALSETFNYIDVIQYLKTK